MLDFSTLPRLVLLLVEVVCFIMAGLLGLIVGVLLVARHGPAGLALQEGEGPTLVLMGVLILVAVVLALAARRELRRM